MTKQRVSRAKVRENLAPAPLFVLVEPQMGENIGAAARAMLNFGVSGLRLVNPRDGWPNPKAAATASGASIVIDETEVFTCVADAIADCNYVVATTARVRELTTPVLEPAAAASNLRARISDGQRCAVLFGGERNGLSSDDVARANAIVTAPANPAFASINLSQAALLIAYEWAKSAGDAAPQAAGGGDDLAHHADVERLSQHFIDELDDAGFFFPPEKRSGMIRNLRAAFAHAGFSAAEVRTLRGAIKALVSSRNAHK